MKRELNKWQVVLRQDGMYEYSPVFGWKRVTFGVFSFKKLPQEGVAIKNGFNTEYYRGFIISFIYWLPIRKH